MPAQGQRSIALEELTAGLITPPSGVPPRSGEPAHDRRHVQITGLAYDSRKVARGDLFVCVPGGHSDGHDFAVQAVRQGAAALVVERPLGLEVPELLVPSARATMAPLAARFFDHPSRELRVVGVTGTNGKTTTAYLVRALLEARGERCGLLGTVKSVLAGRERPVQRTTAEAIDLQADLRTMRDGGDVACAMEVSSHALELGRVDCTEFAVAVFTNLSRDHLDFHETMEAYFHAKRRLFFPERGPVPHLSVINVDDPYGRRLAEEIDGARTFALQEPADYRATDVRFGFSGARFTLHTPAGEHELAIPMPGRFNVENALAALAAAHADGTPLDVLLEALERGAHVPGRFESVHEGQDFAVLVDYAHTPDSLENVLRAARELARSGAGSAGRVLCVFGAGGDRDSGKRPLMGEVAARLADIVLVTSDNPRSEDPERIIAEIMAGAKRAERPGAGRHEGCLLDAKGDRPHDPPQIDADADRAGAIVRAVSRARAGDVVVIAGKGHEQGQEFAGGHKLPFDDVAVVRQALRERLRDLAGAGAR